MYSGLCLAPLIRLSAVLFTDETETIIIERSKRKLIRYAHFFLIFFLKISQDALPPIELE